MVVSLSGTRIRSFLACSTDFRIASGTSRALPNPTPTCPRPSPTTTRAVKENRRPPLTTLATRLMATTRSVRSSALGSIRTSATRCSSLEGQAGRAGRLGERLDPPVVLIAAAIEDNLLDAACLRPLGQQLAHDFGRGHVAARLRLGAEVGGPAVPRGQRAPARIVDHLRVDVAQAAEHRQPRPLRGPDDPGADAQVADLASLDLFAGQHYLPPAFLPTFRRMYSSAYLMPLPLYGSGLRRARSLAAVCPSSALSARRKVMATWRSTSAWIPSGSGNTIGCE